MSTEISVPLSKPGYSYFERQRTVFKQNFASDSANTDRSLDNELQEFDLEVEKIKRDMFKLMPLDFGGGDDFGKIGSARNTLGQLEFKDLSLAEFDKGFASMDKDFDSFDKGTGKGAVNVSTNIKSTMTTTTSSTKTVKNLSGSSRQESFSSVTSSSSGQPSSTAIGLPATSSITAGDASSAMDKFMLKVENPIVQDSQGNKRLQLRFNVNEFKPEEISVKAMDRTLVVVAEHREETATKKVYKKYSRQYILPQKINAESLNAILSADGVLDISAPAQDALEAPIRERLLPIMQL